jgi:prominin 1
MKVSTVFGLVLAFSSSVIGDEMQAPSGSLPPSEGVLQRTVIYESMPPTPSYRSDSTFNPMGMEHVYMISNFFMDLIQRKEFLPPSLNISVLDKAARQGEKPTQKLFFDHWQDIMMQHVGVLTLSLFGILLAFLLPCIGLWFCCCRCCGRCGAYPDTHYDKKSDACKRVTLGIFLSLFVMASVFGVVCALATNYYSYEGTKELSPRLDNALDDTGMYIEHTGASINTLLVTNYKELEAVVGQILDESGLILKDNLAKVTQAIAINNLTDIVSGLGKIRINLKDILEDTGILEERVAQLREGLSESQDALGIALADCNSNSRCRAFLREYNLEKDLALAEEFVNVEFKMPDLANTLKEISMLIQNNIEEKVTAGKEQFDNIEQIISDSIDDIKPKVKQEMRKRGEELEDKNNDIQEALKSIDIGTLHKDVGMMKKADPFFEVRFYFGLGLAGLAALILLCFVFGLFYGMCGRRPGGYYEDECCNKGTGANCLITGVYFFFLFSFVIILGITAHFMLGTTAEKVVCETANSPRDSDIFQQLDEVYFKPLLRDMMNNGGIEKNNYSSIDLLERCHANQTMFKMLGLEKVYNLDEITNWRESYGIGEYIENMKNKVEMYLSNLFSRS